MKKDGREGLTRRDFIKKSADRLAGLGLTSLSMEALFQGNPALAADVSAPDLKLEKNPEIKVLRWSGFVKRDEEIWNANTKRWEQETGGKVTTEYLSWEDVRSKAAMEASVGAGHDIVLGWFDDPHLYPDRLVDVSDVATYLGKKYGGWYPVCEMYGKDSATKRWIALPIGSAGICINYRVGWVKEAGFEKVPDHIEGFIKCAKALKAKGHPTGFALGHAVGDANTWTHWWLWSFGGKAVEADGKTIAINSKETLQALDAVKELYETMIPGVGSWLDPHNNKAFLAGAISVTANGNSIFFVSMNKFPEINKDLMTMNFPVGPVGGRPSCLSQPRLHIQAHAGPQCGETLPPVHVRKAPIRGAGKRHMGLCDPALESLLRSSRLEKGPQNHPLSRLHGANAVERLRRPSGPSLGRSHERVCDRGYVRRRVRGRKVSERRGLGGGKGN